jgi:hypothetical protein
MISRRELLRDAGLALAASGTSMFGAKNAYAFRIQFQA